MKVLAPHDSGFTLVELIAVIIIMGVIAVYAAPRFIGISSVSVYSTQSELLSSLRLTQIRAMNRTDRCNRWLMSSSQAMQVSLEQGASSCATTFPANSTDPSVVKVQSATLSISPSNIQFLDFDNMGRAVQCSGSGSGSGSGCTIQISGEESVNICIETEGYIHAC